MISGKKIQLKVYVSQDKMCVRFADTDKIYMYIFVLFSRFINELQNDKNLLIY